MTGIMVPQAHATATRARLPSLRWSIALSEETADQALHGAARGRAAELVEGSIQLAGID